MNKILQEEPDGNMFDIRDKRELERNTTIPDEKNRGKYNTSAAPTTFGNTVGQCWRGSDLVRDHTRIFWDCPKISDCRRKDKNGNTEKV